MAQTQTRDWSGRDPLRYTDPDLIVLDKRFEKYVIGNTPLQRIWTGAMWAEGPAWNGVGRYLLWSLQTDGSEILANQRIILLLDKAVVILLIGPTPAQLETGDGLAPEAHEMVIEEL